MESLPTQVQLGYINYRVKENEVAKVRVVQSISYAAAVKRF